MAISSGDLTVVVDGSAWGGWTNIRLTRGLERMPPDFDVSVTELYPGQGSQVVIREGSPCTVLIGGKLVLTGYIDRYEPSLSASEHPVRIAGRGRCQDLVDCAAGVRADGSFAMQITQGSAFRIATDLAAPFGIPVSLNDEEAGFAIPRFNINLGESPFEIIDRVTRYRQLIAYESVGGGLVLSRVGKARMASGVVEGQNFENGGASFAMDGRFSDYYVTWTSTDGLSQVRDATGGVNGNLHGYVKDGSVPRFRPRIIVSEQIVDGVDIGQARAVWEMNRRNALAQALSVTIDSWVDGAGDLWEPNRLIPIDLPSLKITGKEWIIGEVTFRRGEDGTHADLKLMPPAAYEPAPSTLNGVDFQTFRALNEANGAS